MPGNPTFGPIRRAGRGRHASGLRIAEACLPRNLRRLFFRLKDLRHFLAGCLREHFRWVGGGSEVGENRPSARSVDFPFTSMPHSPKEETRKDRRCSGRNTSRTARGGSRPEPPGGRATVVLPTSSERPATAGYPERGRGSARWVSRRCRRRLNTCADRGWPGRGPGLTRPPAASPPGQPSGPGHPRFIREIGQGSASSPILSLRSRRNGHFPDGHSLIRDRLHLAPAALDGAALGHHTGGPPRPARHGTGLR